MGRLLFNAVIVGAGWVGLTPAMAISLGLPGLNSLIIATRSIRRRRDYRNHPPPADGDYPPADGEYGGSPANGS